MNLEGTPPADTDDPAIPQTATTLQRMRMRRWLIWPFRILMTLTVLQLFNQAIFAGQFLDGNFDALRAHHDHAYFALYSMIATALSALLVKRPPPESKILIWPFIASVGLIVLIYIQIELGLVRSIAIHVPLGVAIIVAATFLTAWSWRSRP